MILRAAVIGAGKIGSQNSLDPKIKGIYSHAGAYRSNPQTALVALSDPKKEALELARQCWGNVEVFPNTNEMLEQTKPDLVSICSPNSCHEYDLELCLSKSFVKGILVEKPISLRLETALELKKLAEKRNIPVIVNYSRRFCANLGKLRNEINSGRFGNLQHVIGYYTKGFLHNASHLVDWMRWFHGEIETITVIKNQEMSLEDSRIDCDFDFKNGGSGLIRNLNENCYTVFEMDIFLEKGRIKLSNLGGFAEIFLTKESEHYTGYTDLYKKEERVIDLSNTIPGAVQHLVDCVQNGTEPLCSLDDGMKILKLWSQIQNGK